MNIPFLKYLARFFKTSCLVILAFAWVAQESERMPIPWVDQKEFY